MSMKDDRKSVVARQDLVDTLRNLGTNQTFYIYFFPYKAMPATNPLPATQANIDSMTNWIFSTSHSIFGSNPEKAMVGAIKMKPDTIWLLSGWRVLLQRCPGHSTTPTTRSTPASTRWVSTAAMARRCCAKSRNKTMELTVSCLRPAPHHPPARMPPLRHDFPAVPRSMPTEGGPAHPAP